MDTQKFNALLLAVELKTLTKAAEAMGYTQSAISHAINSLEDEFNVRLLLRGRSGVELTPEGHILLPYIRNITNSFHEFENRVAQLNNLDYATIAMVESNLGISVCPELFFYRLPYNVIYRPIQTAFRRKISISYKENFTLSPVMKQFIHHIKQWSMKHQDCTHGVSE